MIIRFSIQCQVQIRKATLPVMPNLARGDYDGIRSFFQTIRWRTMLEGRNIHEMWELFKRTLTEAQSKFIPMKRQREGKSVKPIWFNNLVRQCFNGKKGAFSKMKTNPSAENKANYIQARRTLKKSIRKAKRASEINLANECEGDLKKFFGFYKFNKHDSRIGPIESDHHVYHDDADKVRIFNDQFSSVFTDECLTNFPNNLLHSKSQPKLTNIHLSEDDITKTLCDLKANKSSGPDNISTRVLKEGSRELSMPLSIIFEESIESGEIPEDWRCANVVPIFKGGNKTVVSNYRPISLTSVVCKVLERVIKRQIVAYFEEHTVLLSSQHGFCSGRSCLTNLLDFLEYSTDALDKGDRVSVVYLDFSKAFDKIPHKRLLISLESHGLDGPLLKWIGAWLLGRKQRVIVNGHQSEWKAVKSGVPQGTVLAPLLFIIFVNLIDSDLTSNIWKFADDIKIARNVTSEDDKRALQADLDALLKWSKEWQMEFNVDKCKVLHLGVNNNDTYDLNGTKLAIVNEEKDLRVLVTSDLKLSGHYMQARKKL